MLHITCDICGKEITLGDDHRYVVKMEVFAAHDPAEITEADLDEDHMEAVSQLIRDEDSSLDEPAPRYKNFRYDLCPECHKKFVADFRARYGGKMPDGFACQGYDTAEVILRALQAVNGNTQDKEKLVAAIEKVEFDSPRGRFRFDPKTHNVVQPFIYVREVKEVAGGLNNVVIDRIADVRDPGTGCTLPV